jgi:signal transduction histidine kinase
MSSAPIPRKQLIDNGHIATVAVIAVAYIVTYAAYFADLGTAAGPPFSATALVIATALGIVYLLLVIVGPRPFKPFFGQHSLAASFVVLVVLMLAIAFILAGSNGIWLIFMPIVGTATTDLPARTRWLVYAAVLFGMGAPYYYRYGDWQTAVIATLTFSPAILFVIIFVKATHSAELAQARAETLAAELAEANRKLGDFAVQAEELATIQERNRLAREIHDNLGHYLTVVNVQINAARAILDIDKARADTALDKAARLTQDGLAAVRQSVSSLRESPLGRHTLSEAVADLAAQTQAAGIIAELQVEGLERPLDPRAELTLYRAAQEGLTNVRKHARASRVDLILNFSSATQVVLQICDNGLGSAVSSTSVGFGLLGIEERARQLGGRVTSGAAPGSGYCLTVELPTLPPMVDESGDN